MAEPTRGGFNITPELHTGDNIRAEIAKIDAEIQSRQQEILDLAIDKLGLELALFAAETNQQLRRATLPTSNGHKHGQSQA